MLNYTYDELQCGRAGIAWLACFDTMQGHYDYYEVHITYQPDINSQEKQGRPSEILHVVLKFSLVLLAKQV